MKRNQDLSRIDESQLETELSMAQQKLAYPGSERHLLATNSKKLLALKVLPKTSLGVDTR